MNSLYRAQSEIRAQLAQSDEAEHARHAEDTLRWVMRLKPDADAALALAALGHDLEALDGRTVVQRADHADYDEYKTAHAQASARLLRRLLLRCDVPETVIRRACGLVELHEFGGNPDANVLRDADCLSCFSVNLPLYLERRGAAEALWRSRWNYARLSPNARQLVPDIQHADPRLNSIMQQAAAG